MKARIGILLLLAALPVFAAGTSATLSWSHPTTYTDGAALAASDIKETFIQWRRPGSATVAGSVRVTAPATSVVVPGLVCGNFTFTAQTIMTLGATASDETSPVPYSTGISCKPNPPTGLTAQ
jgi:hypothetical protein